MNLIDWSDDLSLRIDEIDTQHQELIRMINRLHQASLTSDWSGKIITLTDTLLGLIDYLEIHFSTEEKYMIEHDYPEFTNHHKEHSEFVHNITEFANAFKKGRQGLSQEILTFLKDWYIRHVTIVDGQFGAFLKSMGVT